MYLTRNLSVNTRFYMLIHDFENHDTTILLVLDKGATKVHLPFIAKKKWNPTISSK